MSRLSERKALLKRHILLAS
jgi:hypothetical protein